MRVSALLRFEKTWLSSSANCTALADEFLHFSAHCFLIGVILLVDFMHLFPFHKSGNHHTTQETKGLLQLLSQFFCRFRWRVPPDPYVYPSSLKAGPPGRAVFAWWDGRTGRGSPASSGPNLIWHSYPSELLDGCILFSSRNGASR